MLEKEIAKRELKMLLGVGTAGTKCWQTQWGGCSQGSAAKSSLCFMQQRSQVKERKQQEEGGSDKILAAILRKQWSELRVNTCFFYNSTMRTTEL